MELIRLDDLGLTRCHNTALTGSFEHEFDLALVNHQKSPYATRDAMIAAQRFGHGRRSELRSRPYEDNRLWQS